MRDLSEFSKKYFSFLILKIYNLLARYFSLSRILDIPECLVIHYVSAYKIA